MVSYGRLAAHPETEAVKDVWDLRVFGAIGRLSFVGSTTNHGTVSTQPWAQTRCAGMGSRSLGRDVQWSGAGSDRRVGLLSEPLGRRADTGVDPPRRATRDGLTSPSVSFSVG